MLTEVRKGLSVERFHTNYRLRRETVGHHSANVCAILLYLDPDCRKELLAYVILHDVAEAHTGDVPAPAKWGSLPLHDALACAEADYLIRCRIPHYYGTLTHEERALAKLADMTDLVMSSIEEVNMGNRYAEQLVSNGKAYIMGLQVPKAVQARALKLIDEVQNGCK